MDKVRLTLNGRDLEVPEGTTVAVAVFMTGEKSFRQSVNAEPRGPLCGMGICFECRVTLDGMPHQRSCMIPCRQGMKVVTE